MEGGVGTAKGIMLPLFPLHRDGQLVFLTAEEKASLAQVNPGSSEPSDSSLLGRLFSSDISSVYRLGKGMSALVWKYFTGSGGGEAGWVPSHI